jgi:hypothetical protein
VEDLCRQAHLVAIDALHDRHAERTGATDELRVRTLTERN